MDIFAVVSECNLQEHEKELKGGKHSFIDCPTRPQAHSLHMKASASHDLVQSYTHGMRKGPET